LMPDEDTNEIIGTPEAAQGTSYTDMVKYTGAIVEKLRKDPNIRSINNIVSSNSSTGNLRLHMKLRTERQLNTSQIAEKWRPMLAGMPGMRVFLRIPPLINIGTQTTKSAYQLTLDDPDTEELYREAPKFERAMAVLPGLQDISSDLQIKNPEAHVVVDRDKAAAVKLTINDIENALNDSFGSRWVSTMYAPDDEYKVLLELKPEFQADANALSLLYLKSSDGHLIPLSTVAAIQSQVGPLSINHHGQLPAVTMSFNLRPGTSLGEAESRILDLATKSLPASITLGFQGDAGVFKSSLQDLGFLLIIAILVVYVVLGILYESYIHPITILSGLPSAAFGALLTLLVFHVDLNIYAYVGIIMLIGIVKKNAIMQVDFALEAERNEGKSPLEAVYRGCLIRFRPIMMTTMAALLGSMPLALGLGQGGEGRRPLGLAVVGGLLFSQLITLYLTPVIYTYLAPLEEKFRKRKQAREMALPSLTTT